MGGGPTGLTLAAELKLAGVDVAIIERRANQDLLGTRAGGLHAHTIELMELRGLAREPCLFVKTCELCRGGEDVVPGLNSQFTIYNSQFRADEMQSR
jgi:flavin-dependent dehydrogenase